MTVHPSHSSLMLNTAIPQNLFLADRKGKKDIQEPLAIVSLLTPIRDYLQQEYLTNLDRVTLFGSQARGEATELSDIDVLIVLADPVDVSQEIQRTSQFFAEFCLEHQVLVTRLFLSRSRFETENSPLLRNIRRDGIVLHT
jgi:uncharacterized protein